MCLAGRGGAIGTRRATRPPGAASNSGCKRQREAGDGKIFPEPGSSRNRAGIEPGTRARCRAIRTKGGNGKKNEEDAEKSGANGGSARGGTSEKELPSRSILGVARVFNRPPGVYPGIPSVNYADFQCVQTSWNFYDCPTASPSVAASLGFVRLKYSRDLIL